MQFVDLTGEQISRLSKWTNYESSYTENGFSHTGLQNVLNKFTFVLPVNGINMDVNKILSHLTKGSEAVAMGELIQAIIQNEGFDQIFR